MEQLPSVAKMVSQEKNEMPSVQRAACSVQRREVSPASDWSAPSVPVWLASLRLEFDALNLG